MDNRNILIDTSIIIDFLRKQNKENSVLWQIMEYDINCIISTITVFELYAGAITDRHFDDLNKLLKWMKIVSLTTEIAQKAADVYKDLRAKNQVIDFRDIFIGASAILLEIPIATLNKEHFMRISKYINEK
jgi:predicted nucleic acid-binding protein